MKAHFLNLAFGSECVSANSRSIRVYPPECINWERVLSRCWAFVSLPVARDFCVLTWKPIALQILPLTNSCLLWERNIWEWPSFLMRSSLHLCALEARPPPELSFLRTRKSNQSPIPLCFYPFPTGWLRWEFRPISSCIISIMSSSSLTEVIPPLYMFARGPEWIREHLYLLLTTPSDVSMRQPKQADSGTNRDVPLGLCTCWGSSLPAKLGKFTFLRILRKKNWKSAQCVI